MASRLINDTLKGRVAIVTGASRGIGRECALALARAGCNVVVAAKTTAPQPTLPGTIYTVAAEVEALGVQALAVKIDVRDENNIDACIAAVIEKFGRIDILINNASALWWQNIEDTPVKKYDLITSINARGSFLMAQACLPHMRKVGFGRVICMSPPIGHGGMAGHTAYNISKMGMTMVAMGIAQENAGDNITGHSLWPATVIESYASINFELGDPSMWRKASIIADSTVAICCETDDAFTGQMLIDDEYLKSRGITDEELKVYRYDPAVDPPRLLADEAQQAMVGPDAFKRGTVRALKNPEGKLPLPPSKL